MTDQLYQLHRELTRRAVSAQTLDEIAGVIGQFTQQPVLITDSSGRMLADCEGGQHRAAVERMLADSRLRRLWQTLRTDSTARRVPSNPGRGTPGCVVCPIVAGNELLGAVWIMDQASDLTQKDLQAAEHAATVAALYILRQRASAEAEERAGFSLVDSLLQGNLLSQLSWLERLRIRGFQPHLPHVVFVVAPVDSHTQEEAHAVESTRRIAQIVRGYMESVGQAPLLTAHLRNVVGLLPVTSHEPRTQVLGFLRNLHRHLVAHGSPTRLAAGSVAASPSDLGTSWRHSAWALEFAVTEPVCWYGDLRTVHILDTASPAVLREVYTATLGRLFEKDPDLAATAIALVDNNFNLRQAARHLYLHRNTVSYRIELIERICGQSLSDPRFRLNLHLAREVYRLCHHPAFARRLDVVSLCT